ncbi:nitrate/nitrite transporter [Paraeggerthella hongkongensis]|uniref:MFS transporter n=1 Tax=Paraeggerthella hongkongensis TaxID=230658 RepID=A0A3N0AVU5_9ACTN|nr:MFS transporter [Paraeggerthella hongkongensis]RNL38808.1 MFS transporter [Paraeggerthella hongkongensis]
MEKRLQLPLQTADLIVGFMVWVVLSSLLPAIKQDIAIPPDMVALVTAIPIVLGSVLRVPFGYCANLFGARAVFLGSFIVLLFPVWFLSEATTYQELLIGGTFLGIAGAVFSVGVTSLPKYYPKDRHGFVNGVYGFGNMGTALTTWLAPVAALALGWRGAVKLYLVLLVAFAVLNFALGDRSEPRVKTPVMQQLRQIGKDARLWFLSLFYFVTFGAFVALTVYLPNFLTSHYHLDAVTAGAATSIFIVVAATVRVLGGWLSDRFDCYKLLACVFATLTAGAAVLALAPGLPMYLTGIYLISIACGIGNGTVFKLVPTYFTKQAGPANGIVSMWGGLGGFFPPLAMSASVAAFGSNVPGLVAFGLFAAACLTISLHMGRRG